MRKTITLGLALFPVSGALAHGIAGDRLFPATLAIDDPAVSDEATFPQIGRSRLAEPDGGEAEKTTSTGFEYNKRITQDFGLSIGGEYLNTPGSSGWDNVELGAKYQAFVSAPHETLVSVGLDWDVGGSGNRKVGAERFSTYTPTVYFGKGAGDLPDGLNWAKPFALTGTLGYAVPSSRYSRDDDGFSEHNGEAVEWGFTVQYSLPYLQQHVRDLGLPKPFSQLIPIVEFAFESPTSGAGSGHTTGSINPGFIWEGQSTQVGVEAVIPAGYHASSGGVGVVGQLHFFFDDLFPTTLGKPIF